MDVINPATGEVFAQAPRASREQLDDAVAAANAGQRKWAALSVAERAGILRNAVDRMEANAGELARLLTLEQGKPLAAARHEVGAAALWMRETTALSLDDEVLEDSPQRHVLLRRRPLGVVAAITPWNFPLMILSFKLAPALLAGNAVIVKPAGTTPLATLRLIELIADLFPAGVLSSIADANDLGEAITTHEGIHKISFTGSTATGRRVMASAAGTIKRLTLELGGNDAAILLDDIDVQRTVAQVFRAAFMNSGQTCLAIKRLYVHDAVYDEVCDALAALASAAVVGDGLEQGTQFGPLQNRMQYDRVRGLLDQAREKATVLAGGDHDGPGYFIRPAVVRDIDDDHPLVTEEQFGPLLPVLRFTDEEDVLNRANAVSVGLGGSVWSADPDRARRLAERIESGTVWVNNHVDMSAKFPLAGAKQSGLGVEFGPWGLHEFTQVQVLNVHREVPALR